MKIDTLCAKNILHANRNKGLQRGKKSTEDLFRDIVLELLKTDVDELMALRQPWHDDMERFGIPVKTIELCMKAVDIVIADKEQQEREKRFRAAREKEIQNLYFEKKLCESVIEKGVFSPLSKEKERVMEKLRSIDCRLDILCGLNGNEKDVREILLSAGYLL